LDEKKIGFTLSEAIFQSLSVLNTNVKVKLLPEQTLTSDIISNYSCVICSKGSYDEREKISELCHSLNVAFFSCDTRGVFSSVFCDLGEEFEFHRNGNHNRTSFIKEIVKDQKTKMILIDDQNAISEQKGKNFEIGDFVYVFKVENIQNNTSFEILNVETQTDSTIIEINLDSTNMKINLNDGSYLKKYEKLSKTKFVKKKY
jgi:molybdopterin/thiamine biosynthesis adenylyltransferase